jgi:hypothetical protein
MTHIIRLAQNGDTTINCYMEDNFIVITRDTTLVDIKAWIDEGVDYLDLIDFFLTCCNL